MGAQPGRCHRRRSRRTTRSSGPSCNAGPASRRRLASLLDQIKPTLPILLANLTTVGQILAHLQPVTRTASGAVPADHRRAAVLRLAKNNPTGLPHGRLRADHQRSDRRARSASCRRRSGVTGGHDDDRHPGRVVLQAAAGLADRRARCPQLSVHGAPRQSARPRSSSATIREALCRWRCASHHRAVSVRPEPDRAGRAADDRTDFNDRIYAPVEGTPLPPGAVPAGTPPGAAPGPCTAGPACSGASSAAAHRHLRPGNSINGTPVPRGSGRLRDGAVPAAPSAFGGNGPQGPSVAIAHYDPRTGEYLTPDGQLHAADESGRRSGAEVVEGPAPDLTSCAGSADGQAILHADWHSMTIGLLMPHAPLWSS